jgi:hypothetical protein
MYLKVKKTLNKILLFNENFDIYSKFITNFKKCFNQEKNMITNNKYFIIGGIYEIDDNIFSHKFIKLSSFSYLKINKNIIQFQEGLNKNEKNIFSKILFNPYDKCLYIENELIFFTSKPKYSFLLFYYHCVINKKIKILFLTENSELKCNCEVYYYLFNYFFYGFYIKNDEQKEIKYMYELFDLIFETNFFI